MKPTTPVAPGFDFPLTVFGAEQPEYLPLPAVRCTDQGKTIVTRWALSWQERIQVLFGGTVWLSIMTFGKPIQPVKLEAGCPFTKEAAKP